MAGVSVTWHGDAVLASVAAAVAQGLGAAGRVMATNTKRDISTPYPPASRPGQPPHMRSGGLRSGVTSRVERSGHDATLFVGVPEGSAVVRQAEALQRGTGRMAARPFLPSLDASRTLIVGYVVGAIKAVT